jgi:hypothetical protein
MAEVFALVAAALVGLWGVAHAIPTATVLKGFEPITADNRHVIKQEWLAEAFTMWGLAALLIGVTVVGPVDSGAVSWVYQAAAGLLVALAILTIFTGARTPVIWFKICPVLLLTSATLLITASLV